MHSTLNHWADAHYELDARLHFLSANEGAEQFLGIPRESLIGNALLELFPQARNTPFQGRLQNTVENGIAEWFEGDSLNHLGLDSQTLIQPNTESIHIYSKIVSDIHSGPVIHSAPANSSPLPRTSEPIRVLLVDDHRIIRQGLAGLLNEEEDIQVVGEAENAFSGMHLAKVLP